MQAKADKDFRRRANRYSRFPVFNAQSMNINDELDNSVMLMDSANSGLSED